MSSQSGEIAHGAMRGAIGAMAMSGMRTLTKEVGILRQTPPESMAGRRRASGILARVPKGRRKATVELLHWAVGVAGGAIFGALPDPLRRATGFGPVYGLAILLSYDLGIAPLMGLKQSRRPEAKEQCALIADHLLYGLILSELRGRPSD